MIVSTENCNNVSTIFVILTNLLSLSPPRTTISENARQSLQGEFESKDKGKEFENDQLHTQMVCMVYSTRRNTQSHAVVNMSERQKVHCSTHVLLEELLKWGKCLLTQIGHSVCMLVCANAVIRPTCTAGLGGMNQISCLKVVLVSRILSHSR